jgi:hypothetical protein
LDVNVLKARLKVKYAVRNSLLAISSTIEFPEKSGRKVLLLSPRERFDNIWAACG